MVWLILAEIQISVNLLWNIFLDIELAANMPVLILQSSIFIDINNCES